MFLYTRMQKPIIADKDIVCYVYIRKCDNVKEKKQHGVRAFIQRIMHKCDPSGIIFSKYYEPYRNVEIKPGTTIASKSKRKYNGEYNGINHYRVEDGFINATIRPGNYGDSIPYEAIIPSGTEFYVNNGLFKIAARKLRISKEPISSVPNWRDSLESIMHILSDNIFCDDYSVRPGFYYLSDGSYINPNKLAADKASSVVGVVSDVTGDEVTVMSLDEISMTWCSQVSPKRIFSDNDKYLNGEKLMLELMRNDAYGDDFCSARWCSKYEVNGGTRGNWHMGSIQEVTSAIRNNMLEINIAIALLGQQFRLLDSLSKYWTIVDSEDDYAYEVDGCDGVLVRGNKTLTESKVRAFMTKMNINPLYM